VGTRPDASAVPGTPAPAARDERFAPWVYGSVLAALVAGAWAGLGLAEVTGAGAWLSHAGLGEEGALAPSRVLAFLAAWTLMSVAMMLPSTFPLVRVFLTITEGSGGLLALLCAGYLAIWALFGVAALLGDAGVHRALEGSTWLAARPERLPGALLLGAGLFQFSPLKYSCLRQCRSPLGFVIQHWRGASRALRALRVGVWHGLYCVGCCWALMVVMFAVGAAHLGWMLALAAVMFVEKAVTWGRRATVSVGVALGAWGLALLLGIPGVPRPF
jgi:predicted metal-binding membrane protein